MSKPKEVAFVGWGMTSKHALPWETQEGTDQIGLSFFAAEKFLKKLIEEDKFILSQFQEGNKSLYPKNVGKVLAELRYRHFFVYWSACIAARFTNETECNFIEAGTCDGLTIYFATDALKSERIKNNNPQVFLYDSWAAMKSEFLTAKELGGAGNYSYLSLEQTKKNLKVFEGYFEFVQGFIPDVLISNPGPNLISWLHIDLNSSMPTQKALEHFFPKLSSRGIVLFDDYGWRGYAETKTVVDKFFSKDDGFLMPLPTGQAIFFKR